MVHAVEENIDETLSRAEVGSPKSFEKHARSEDIDTAADHGRFHRTGNVWTGSAHVITAVIGSGVLSLPWSIAQLGWIAGPTALLFFAFVTYYNSTLLADCYRTPNTTSGKRNPTYMQAVKSNLGSAYEWLCGFVQLSLLWGTAIGYTITASTSMVAIKRSNCFHAHGKNSVCHVSNNPYMIIFGVIQLILSQIPNFHKIWWLSSAAAVMSFSYSLIGLGLSIQKVTESSHSYGTIGGISVGHGIDAVTEATKVWQVFQAMGNIAFAYAFSLVLIEIEDTLKNPPAESKTMKKITLISISTTSSFYMTIGFIGYAAFGNNAPGNLLTGFGFYNPYWLIDFANACIVVHLIGAFQVYSQPIFAFVERWLCRLFPENKSIQNEYILNVPLYGELPLNLLRLAWRTGFVVSITLVAMLLPFFNDVVGLIGAYGFWPLTVYFPTAMYIRQNKIQSWTSKWIWMQIMSTICLLVSMAAALGSIQGIHQKLKHYSPFKTE